MRSTPMLAAWQLHLSKVAQRVALTGRAAPVHPPPLLLLLLLLPDDEFAALPVPPRIVHNAA